MKFTLIRSPSYGNNYPPSTHPHTYHIMTTTSTCRMHWGVKSSINKRMLLETTNGNQRTPATTQQGHQRELLQSSPCIVPFVHSVVDSTRTCIHHPPYFQPPTPSTHCHHHSIVIVGCRWGRFYWLYKPQCPIHTSDQPIPQTWTGQHGNRTEQNRDRTSLERDRWV